MRQVLSQGPTKVTFKPLFAGSTSNVFKNVMLGKSAAGATLDVDFERESSDVSSQVRPIYTTEKIAPHPLAAHPRVPEAIRDKVRAAVLGMGNDPGSGEMLKTIRMPAPMAADYDRDYRSIEAFDLETLAGQGL